MKHKRNLNLIKWFRLHVKKSVRLSGDNGEGRNKCFMKNLE